MLTDKVPFLRRLVGGALLILAPLAAYANSWSTWDASSGLLPDQITPAWTLGDFASPQDPVLANGYLTLSSTSANNQYMYYAQAGEMVDTSGTFVIEARLRYVSGATDHPDRTGSSIGFVTAPNIGNALFIHDDEVFFNSDNMVKGPTALVDTNDAFHTYRIEVSADGSLALYYDSLPILTAATFFSEPFNGPTQGVMWGDGTFLASATSEWSSFSHNALAVPLPASAWLFGSAVAALGLTRRRRT